MWTTPQHLRAEGEGADRGQPAFGVSLRLSASSARPSPCSAAERDKLKKFLADNNMYLYTVNAFPYGAFKNTVVKEQVYEPDWRSEERTHYTINVADDARRCRAG